MSQNQYTVRVAGMESLEEALTQLPEELHFKILPADGVLALRRTSKTMRTAVQKARVHARIRARDGVCFPDGRGLLDNLNDLMAGCNLTALDLHECQLRDGGARVILEFLRPNTTLRKLVLGNNDLGDGGAHALAEVLRLNTTLRDLDLESNDVGDGGARALADALRLNTTLHTLNLNANDLGDRGARALAEALRRNTTLMVLDLGGDYVGEDT